MNTDCAQTDSASRYRVGTAALVADIDRYESGSCTCGSCRAACDYAYVELEQQSEDAAIGMDHAHERWADRLAVERYYRRFMEVAS